MLDLDPQARQTIIAESRPLLEQIAAQMGDTPERIAWALDQLLQNSTVLAAIAGRSSRLPKPTALEKDLPLTAQLASALRPRALARIRAALVAKGGNQKGAAEALGTSLTSFKRLSRDDDDVRAIVADVKTQAHASPKGGRPRVRPWEPKPKTGL